MDRKAIIAISLSVLVIGWYQFKVVPRQAQYRQQQLAAQKAAAPTPVPASTQPEAAIQAPVATEPVVEESKEVISSPVADYTFTNVGGGIALAKLKNHIAEHGEKVEINKVGSAPIGAVTFQAEEKNAAYVVKEKDAKSITYERVTPQQVQITKRYQIAEGEKEEYAVILDVSFTNRGAEPYELGKYYLHNGAISPIHEKDQPLYTAFDWTGKSNNIQVNWFSASWMPLVGNAERSVFAEDAKEVKWSAVISQYFTTIVTVLDGEGDGVWARRIAIKKEGKHDQHGIQGAMRLPGKMLNPGETYHHQFRIYTGPKEYRRLVNLKHGEADVMNFGWFKIVSQFLLNSMNWLNSVLGNYATAILVLTLFIKLALWPLQNKATASMKKMSALSPKMTELREKYKDDPTRMNQEIMKLYKDYGVNPFGGCLPMLIQIPIFFGFYNMLGTAVELRNSQFLWVQDLSQPDTVFHLLGFPINILPLLMAATMLWQMHITPKSGDAMQQRVFMFVPLIFIFFCYNFASALALYWTTQNIFSIVQLYLTRDKTIPPLKKIASPVPTKKARK